MYPTSSGQICWWSNLYIPWFWVPYICLLGTNVHLSCLCIFRDLYDVLNAWTITPIVTSVHEPLWYTSQRRLFSVPPLLRIWCTLCARYSAAPMVSMDYWCNVCPIGPFFWLETFSVAKYASKSLSRDSFLERILLFFKKAHVLTYELMSPSRSYECTIFYYLAWFCIFPAL